MVQSRSDSSRTPPVPPRVGDTLRLQTRAMACDWCVILNPGATDQVLHASAAFEEVYRLETLLTVYRPDSEVSQLNQSPPRKPVPVSPELRDILILCRDLTQATSGAFDVAVHPLIQTWQQARRDGRIPDQSEIDAVLERTGMRHLAIENSPGTVEFLTAGVALNFGAIGKGIAIDRAWKRLETAGVTDALIHGGHSSLYAAGTHLEPAGWPVGLKNPLFTEESYLTLLLRDRALATSGSNIQFFRSGGKRYGHILDPRTGWPASGLLSVSVVAPTAAEADALSTAFYVLGLEKSLEYCDTHPSVGAVLTPPPTRGRLLRPILRNLPRDSVYLNSPDIQPEFPDEPSRA